MSLVPPDRPRTLTVDAEKHDRGGRHRAALPRHEAPRRLPVGGIVGIVAAAIVVVVVIAAGGIMFWQSKLHADAVTAYGTALTSWQGAQRDADSAQRSLENANAALAAERADGTAILGAAADGFVGKDQKAALAAAVAAFPAAPASPAPTDPSASPAPTPAAPTAPASDATIDDVDAASIDDLKAAAAALDAAAEGIGSTTEAATAEAADAQQSQQDLETLVAAVLTSAAEQGRTWLGAFVGKTAQAGQKLDAALTALEQSSATTTDRAALLGAVVTWDGPAVPGALSDPNSIYVVVDKLHPINDFDEKNAAARSWAPGGLASVGNGQSLRKVAATALKQLMADARAAGHSVPALSCYRSWASQNATYAHWVAVDGSTTMADSHSARPGYSEHQTGLACDIGSGSQSWGGTAAGKWTAAHAADYGFILRYDDGKEKLSGYVYEPWHFRYVGVATAQAIYAAGNPTLEQWMGLAAPKTYSDGSGDPDAESWNG